MIKIGEDIWTHEDEMKLMCVQLGLRMTVVKLEDGGLWVHSPTALSPELKKEVESIGPVRFIVGASNGHNLWLQEWQQAFPDAKLYVSGGIPKKLKLTDYQLLDENFDNIWQQDLEHQAMPDTPFFNESVFLHKKTKSLIVTDLIQNYPAEACQPGFSGIILKYLLQPIGFKGMCIAPPLKMGFTIKDKERFSSFITKIKTWDFERIIVTHGDIIDTNATQIFTDLTERFLK